jgi:putative NADH-flavin reductase
MNALEQLRQHPELEWSFLAPSVQLEPGERTETIRLGTDRLLADAKGQSKISVQDFAVAMINELEDPQHVRPGSQRATDLRLPS